ncbi:MAG: reverse transcriptase domain-containing protein [Bacteroidales bacterium]|nr:reverse transcriptase domain-containing protein [Bacteroidales bacterium]
MKRAGNLIEKIADLDNLYLAYYKTNKGKQTKKEALDYRQNLQSQIVLLREQILSGNISTGNYHYFKIYDPKERLICAASFPERVLHHAIMNICHPFFEKTLIFDTYATRIDKGIYKALEKAKKAMHNYQYVAKLDFRKYFDSIPHEILRQKLATKFKDKQLLALFDKIIDSYCVTKGFGVPIGNLTSQYFANFYLSEYDHFIKEKLKIKIYLRYMDDMLLFSNNKEELKQQLIAIYQQAENLQLTLKPVVLNKTQQGISFLGYKLYPHKILLNRTSKLRFKTKFGTYQNCLNKTIWDDKTYQQHIMPLLSFVQHAYTKRLRKEIIEGSNRVLRGGSWNNNAQNCRVSNRNNNIGFRLALAHKKIVG